MLARGVMQSTATCQPAALENLERVKCALMIMSRFTSSLTRPHHRAGRATRGLRAAAALTLVAQAMACDSSSQGAFDVTIDCTAATAWTFPDTAPGQTASVLLLATRTDEGDPDGAGARLAIDGPDAGLFHVAASTCEDGSFAPGDTCATLIEYTPTAEGAHAATLHLGKTTLSLGGTAAAAPQGLVASIRNATSMHGFYSFSSNHTVRLVNESATDITLGTGTFTGTGAEFAASAGCPAVLTPGAVCELQLAVGPQRPGCAAATYRLPSSLNEIEIPVSLSHIGGVSVSLSGMGGGRIVSSPPGIDCRRGPAAEGVGEGRCAQVFTGPVTLTAIPDAGHHFNGWEHLRCGLDEACTVMPVTVLRTSLELGSAHASFASPGAKQIDVTIAGSGKGLVSMPGGRVTCESSCTGWIEADESGTIEAGAPSQFTGWSGSCSGTASRCDLGIVVNDRAATATFAPDDREQATLLPRQLSSVSHGGFTPDGELVVAGGLERDATIARLSLAGDLRWSTQVAATAASLEVAPSGDIYFLGWAPGYTAGVLIKLDAAGSVVWERPTPVPGAGSSSLALTPSGGAAIVVGTSGLGASEVRTYAADGSLAWSAATPDALGIAVAPSGITAVASFASNATTVRRFSASGAPLAPSWTLPSNTPRHPVSLAYDAQGFLSAQTRLDSLTEGTYTLTRLDPTGATVFAKPIIVTGGASNGATTRDGGVVVTPSSTVFSWLSHTVPGRLGSGYNAGVRLETYDPQGARTWMLDKLAWGGRYLLEQGVVVHDATCGPGRCAVLGSYTVGGDDFTQTTNSVPWIEVFTVP